MANLLIESFDRGGALTPENWSATTNTNIASSGRTGKGGANANSLMSLVTRTFTASGGFVFGYVVQFTSYPGSATAIIKIREGTTVHLDLRIDATGHLIVTRNGTTLETSTATLNLNTWYYLEFKGTINDSTGTYEVRVDESTTGWPSGSGADTRNGGTGAWDNVNLTAYGTGGTVTFDDLYVNDTSGSAPDNDYWGNTQIECKVAQTDAVGGAGGVQNFTPSTGTDHGALVDEATPNDDTDYVFSGNAGDRDTFNFAALSLSGTVRAVQVALYEKKTDAGARTVKAVVRTGAVNYDHATAVTPATTYQYNLWRFATDPSTGSAWTVSGINGAEFGAKVES